MADPLVSVKMITYNHGPYIGRAIECVLAQKTNFRFELVIGEDCSTDETRRIVASYAARFPDKIILITSEKNVGLHENIRRTDVACRGKYLAYCEGDDYWQRDDKLQMQVDYLERHPECSMVCSDYDEYDTKTKKRTRNYRSSTGQPVLTNPDIFDILSGKADVLTCTVLLRRETIRKVKEADPFLHQSGHFRMGDTQAWAEMSLWGKIHVFSESLATRQLLPESATQSSDPRKRLRFWISNSEMCIYLCEKHQIDAALKNAHFQNWTKNSLKLAFLEKSCELADKTKKKSPEFSFKNNLWYWGTKHSTMRPFILLHQLFFQDIR